VNNKKRPRHATPREYDAGTFALLIPTGSDHDRTRAPLATLSLIALNILAYFLANLLDYDAIVRRLGFVAADPQLHQFLTHMFLHAGWPARPDAEWTAYVNSVLHIGGNMAYLWFAGSDLEDALGSLKFLLVYFLGGIASALLFWATAVAGNFPNLDEPAVGASGAVSALLGLYLVRFPRFKIRLWFAAVIPFPLIMRQGIARLSSWFFIGFWIGLQLFFGVHALRAGGAEVAYWGHIGGFLLGLAYGLSTRQWRDGQQEYLFKEAEHLFYKQKWYPAMEAYQLLARRYPRCADAYLRWALCWECAGFPKRAEKVLFDARQACREQGWEAEADRLQAELQQLGAVSAKAEATATPPPAAAPNLMFRREFKWKEKPR